MEHRIQRIVETPFGKVQATIWTKEIVFGPCEEAPTLRINNVEYVVCGNVFIDESTGTWSHGSYTNVHLRRTDHKDAYSSNANVKWGKAINAAAIELATPEMMKEAEWNEAQRDLAKNVATQDDLTRQIAELKQKEAKLVERKDAIELELRQIKRRAS